MQVMAWIVEHSDISQPFNHLNTHLQWGSECWACRVFIWIPEAKSIKRASILINHLNTRLKCILNRQHVDRPFKCWAIHNLEHKTFGIQIISVFECSVFRSPLKSIIFKSLVLNFYTRDGLKINVWSSFYQEKQRGVKLLNIIFTELCL